MFVRALFAGKPQPFGPRRSPSSIIKQSFEHLDIDFEGAVQDEQGNKKLHGGPEMALHQYSDQGYQELQNAFPSIAHKLIVGSIGENISAPDMTDESVYIGDIYRIGNVLLQVSSPRMPCVKINQRYQAKSVDLHISEQGITGWYYRVIETGTIGVGDAIVLDHRLQQTLSIKQLMRLVKPPKHLLSQDADLQLLVGQRVDVANNPALAKEWVRKLQKPLR